MAEEEQQQKDRAETASILERLEHGAPERGETLAQAIRHHLLEGIVARVARSPGGEGFVLRGGLLTRHWVKPLPRPTTDLDYVGDFEFDLDAVAVRFRGALGVALDDGIVIEAASFAVRGIWLDTAFPGARVRLELGIGSIDHELTVDIGFNDPLVPETTWQEVSGSRIRCIRPETQVSWKLHALAEMGNEFRPKDLADLWRIVSRVPLDNAALAPAIAAAFTSRGYRLEDATTLLEKPYWATKSTRVRWTPNRTGAGLPPLPRVLDEVRVSLAPALAALRG